MQSMIIGTGIGLPETVVPNSKLAAIMDTTDEWIQTRSGIMERRFAAPGEGSAALGAKAGAAAIESAGIAKDEVDAVVFATMTPDFVLPSNGPLLQNMLGLPTSIPTFDLRQQCSGFLYGLDLTDSLIRSGKYRTILLIGAEAHTPFMPWESGWDTTIGLSDREVSQQEKDWNTKFRDRTVLFGDGAGAVVVRAADAGEKRGFLAAKLYTDGSASECLTMKGASFRRRPFVTKEQVETGETIPVMSGREVYKNAVVKMPEVVKEVTESAGYRIEDLDLLLVHQANLRIVEAVQKALGLPPEKVPHNIERYGNTTAATLPILYHECMQQGLIKAGSLIAFTALGSGLHWGAALYRA